HLNDWNHRCGDRRSKRTHIRQLAGVWNLWNDPRFNEPLRRNLVLHIVTGANRCCADVRDESDAEDALNHGDSKRRPLRNFVPIWANESAGICDVNATVDEIAIGGIEYIGNNRQDWAGHEFSPNTTCYSKRQKSFS